MSDIQNALVEALRNSAPSRRLMHTAADEIETLENYEAFYRDMTDRAQKLARRILSQFPAWIPVTERLPFAESGNASKEVLVTDGQDIATAEWFNFDMCEPYWSYTGIGDITHWMPLPEPPTEVET